MKQIVVDKQKTVTPELANEFFKKGGLVGYKNGSYIGLLTRLEDQSYGFAVYKSSNPITPKFIRSNSLDCIKEACKESNSNREVFTAESFEEI